ncbi:hypothetical protein EJ05DRAFT_514304 [Pseudovirgaria hyperparasitica]|uniref:F-box domain-containing protein n=1 Tax=Pseudovirgaria hyperparasitica TaxID=470096 RepID=A0A6A6VVW7_9PEZI|nr:uncharacterized protein EJ05DRAFT_514304 [Pseudovirgaria hyperparasitica]KAF2754305.1 hypothetical protein EJ05DRAFT_514304 [Pseudovirgaria hyperparasitica]
MTEPGRSSVLELPAELIHEILTYLSPGEISNFGLSCKQARGHLDRGNKSLWRRVFLNVFENPQRAWQGLTPTARANNKQREEEWDWYGELERRLEARRIILDDDVTIELKRDRFEDVMHALLDILETGRHNHKYFNDYCPHPYDRNLEFLEDIFQVPKASFFLNDFTIDRDSALPFEDHSGGPMTRSRTSKRRVPECASQIHIYHGITESERTQERPGAKSSARELVYDWSKFSPDCDYGPFHPDGSVNWHVVEAVSSLMAQAVHMQADNFQVCPFEKPATKYPCDPETDWAGISYERDVWMGTYAFLDYADLALFNFERARGVSISLGEFDEASGLLSRLCLHRDDRIKDDQALKTRLPVCEDLPTIYFSGSSQSQGLMHTHGAGIRGCVSLVPGGKEVRWRFIIRYSGLDQWQLEGVQPGGIRTGPIFGIWSGCDHEENGPVGPFSYYTEEEEEEEEEQQGGGNP